MVELSKSGNWNGITNQDYLVHIQLVQDSAHSGVIGMILTDCKNVHLVFARPSCGKKWLGLFSKKSFILF